MVNWRLEADSTACACPMAAVAHRIKKRTKADRLIGETYLNTAEFLVRLHISLDGVAPK
jgi:hypothetical protein